MSVSFRPLLTPQMIADEVVGDEEAEERDPHIFQISGFLNPYSLIRIKFTCTQRCKIKNRKVMYYLVISPLYHLIPSL